MTMFPYFRHLFFAKFAKSVDCIRGRGFSDFKIGGGASYIPSLPLEVMQLDTASILPSSRRCPPDSQIENRCDEFPGTRARESITVDKALLQTHQKFGGIELVLDTKEKDKETNSPALARNKIFAESLSNF